MQKVSITSFASISSLGSDINKVWENYLSPKHSLSQRIYSDIETFVGAIPSELESEIRDLRNSDLKYKPLDRSVLLGILTARKAVKLSGWSSGDFGINLGSSRGATELFEKYYDSFLENQKAETLTSPTTTLGNLSTWIAHDLQSVGPTITHSITCSTALHAVLNGVAWINSGMNEKFLVGGTEAPLTNFTIAQMKALKIYADNKDQYPCKTLDFAKKRNTMVLGEGAAVFCLESGIKENALALIEGVGYATEQLKHNISISDDADCFQKSMTMALKGQNLDTIDAIVMHAPGTIKGDTSEYNAIDQIFGKSKPALTSNKWKIGHTFGASGALSLELALLMIQNQKFIPVPFIEESQIPNQINKVLVNAVGFGGNAVSILVSRTD